MKSNFKMKKNWHAVYVSSRQEKKVTEAFQKKGIESYLPLLKTLRNWSDRKKLVELPLLPGYVFVQMQASEKDSVLQTKGVVSFLRCEGKIGIVRNEEIEGLKQLISLGYNLSVFRTEKKLVKGDKIKINSGHLKNIEGFIIEEKGESFFDVYLESVEFNVRVKLPEELLIKL